MKRIVATFLLLCPALVAVQCGFFSPRAVEPPTQGVWRDPLELNSILTGTELFFKNDARYHSMFDAGCRYEDDFGNVTWGRDEIVDRLQVIVDRYEIVSAVWLKDTTAQDVVVALTRGTLYRMYRLEVRRKSDGTTSFPEGEARFDLSYDAESHFWTIRHWRDSPTIPFFHPEHEDYE